MKMTFLNIGTLNVENNLQVTIDYLNNYKILKNIISKYFKLKVFLKTFKVLIL